MADTAKHTPGNWKATWSKYREGEYIVQTDHPSRRVIATFDDDGDGAGERSIADADLIAAAPDLLEAAQDAVSSLEAEFGRLSAEVNFPKLYAAISKATGDA